MEENVKEMKNAQDIMDNLMHGGLSDILEFESENYEDFVWVPEISLRIYPYVDQLEDGQLTIAFHMYSEEWKTGFFEMCSAAANTINTSVGLSLGAFAYGFMNGLRAVANGDFLEEVGTEFAGKPHTWKVYMSNRVGMGRMVQDPQENAGNEKYWNLLKEELVKRLGNQRITYVKIYGAKWNGGSIGECRVNDVEIPELSGKVKEMADTWEVDGFASEKIFFFFVQDEETFQENPYAGTEGRMKMKENIIQYLSLLQAANSEDDEEFQRQMAEVEDKASQMFEPRIYTEMSQFLPEICAERAFGEKMRISDVMEICTSPTHSEQIYKAQLFDYYLMGGLIFEIFDEGIFGEDTNRLYRFLVFNSSIGNVVQQVMEKKGSLDDCVMTSTIFSFPEDYVMM